MIEVEHVQGRQELVDALKAELLGPAPSGTPIDTHGGLEFPSVDVSYGPYYDRDSGEEILAWDRPVARYGVGVLFPPARADEALSGAAEVDSATEERAAASLERPSELVGERVEREAEKISRRRVEIESDELDLSAATARHPSSMGVSFLVKLDADDQLIVEASGGRYEILPVRITGRAEERRWFVRRAWSVRAQFRASTLHAHDRRVVRPDVSLPNNLGTLQVGIEAYARSDSQGRWLVTITLVNRTAAGSNVDTSSLFQVDFSAWVEAGGVPQDSISAYPAPPIANLDPEERSLTLLYRRFRAFAVGHGCAADWTLSAGGDRAVRVHASVLPAVETASITPDVLRPDGTLLTVRMATLASLRDEPSPDLGEVLAGYANWVREQERRIDEVPEPLRATAREHVGACAEALLRMREGLQLLQSDSVVARAFRLANHAMLLQQLRTYREPRLITRAGPGAAPFQFSRPFPPVDAETEIEGRGSWRPFQIAFLLMNLSSVSDGRSKERDVVELIWFPTGGGKTEAYLGLSAFSMFLRRLRDRTDTGVDVLMRYTLRLLTAQQFQRASTLICAMEYLRRRDNADLGDASFRIGIWLGQRVTPNTRKDALQKLTQLAKRPGAENPFLVTRCPWCAAQMGPVRGIKDLAGYKHDGVSVRFRCPDQTCDFKHGLPILLVDEDLYEEPPSLLIGTVDKFAMLAWRPEARNLFGIDKLGRRAKSPPNLVIQDELHLISGPLGTMVGLYEMVVEELCTDDRGGRRTRPKIVTSTATARRFREQVRCLFGRTSAALFPPPGLDVSDSFFARYATNPDGSLQHGRLYLGVHASNHNSLITTQVQAMASTLQAGMHLPPARRDPWWTVMVFFNTLRELGTSLSLVQSNVPMYLKTIRNRLGLDYGSLRHIDNVLELTSRLNNDEVPGVMAQLEISTESRHQAPVDLCLSSNIIEVGIDIDRLSLMLVVGQPKSTSQYIQVTGRIGRLWWKRPGLVVTLLNPSRARDRSHYEQFVAYHQRLYAQVEPTTVTPFSPPALERALHAALTAFVRQFGVLAATVRIGDTSPALLERFCALSRARANTVDPEEAPFLEATLQRKLRQLKKWANREWGGFAQDPGQVLSNSDWQSTNALTGSVWATPTSMRTVDAECELEITAAYALMDDLES